MDKETKEAIEKVGKYLERLDPLSQRYITKIIDKDGTSVALSVACNMSTSLMCVAMLLVEASNGDVDEFMEMVIQELVQKHKQARVKAMSQVAILQAQYGDGANFTCRPLH
jgi:hypothetical protein